MKQEIVHYVIEGSDRIDEMETKVNRLIEQGYQPYGLPFYNTSWRYVQVMVKYKPQSQGLQL